MADCKAFRRGREKQRLTMAVVIYHWPFSNVRCLIRVHVKNNGTHKEI